jgi:precorrin-6x reductase
MIIVFAGTSDARECVYLLAEKTEKILVCVTTAYGASLYASKNNIEVMAKPLDKPAIFDLIKLHQPEKVVDATHPYADEISANLIEVCADLGVQLEKKQREQYFNGDEGDCEFFEGYEACAQYLSKTNGNILLTIGSRRLKYFSDLIAKDRMIIRVLGASSVLKSCEALGYLPKNIVAAQGPFSYEFNKAMMIDYDIKYLVTKDSGKKGGVHEKFMAAKDCGVKTMVIKRV